MEERIIEYFKDSEIHSIITELSKQNFLLVKHDSQTKKLYFKQFDKLPETLEIVSP